jgi:DNA transposition AAA+ family ATPase
MANRDHDQKRAHSCAALKNVAAMMDLVSRLQARGPHVPGLGVFYGPAGLGKSTASIYAMLKTRAVRIMAGDSWTRKTVLRAILKEVGVAEPKGTIPDLMEQVVHYLGDEPDRPLIIDEADHLVRKGMIEIVREIHEFSQAPVVLIGEESLPGKLLVSERTYSRVLQWAMAVPCDREDARKLANWALPDNLAIADDLLEKIREECDGRARRIVVNLTAMAEFARSNGPMTLDLKNWPGSVDTGAAPVRRAGPRRPRDFGRAA